MIGQAQQNPFAESLLSLYSKAFRTTVRMARGRAHRRVASTCSRSICRLEPLDERHSMAHVAGITAEEHPGWIIPWRVDVLDGGEVCCLIGLSDQALRRGNRHNSCRAGGSRRVGLRECRMDFST